MSKRKQRQRPTLLTRICSLLLVLCMTISTNAGIVYAATDTGSTSHKLQNGSFEEEQTWKGAYEQIDQSLVPYWNTTAKGGLIELLRENPNTYIPGVKVKPTDGLIAAELNADEESTLYQNIKTSPSSVYQWGIDHGARNDTDTMALVIGPSQETAPSKPDKNGRDQFMQMIDWCISQNLTSIKTEAGLGEHLTIFSKKFAENGTFSDNAGNNAFSLTPSTIYTEEWQIWIMASSKATTETENPWYSYGSNSETENNSSTSGGQIGLDKDKYYLYTVPEGQTNTIFAFVSVGVYGYTGGPAKQNTYGNFLDNINFEIYHPLSGSTTTHGSAVVSDSAGSIEGDGAADGYEITVDNQLTTYITDGETLKIQAVIKKIDADNSCGFVGVYYTTRDENDNPVTQFIQTANNSNWTNTVDENGDILYTYYLENITSPTDLHFIFIKNPTITYDPNGGQPYIVAREYNTAEADNVYSFKPAVNENAGPGESATIFIAPYESHAAVGQNDGWKFTGWLLTGDAITETPPEELGTLILPAEHTIACDYNLSNASSENAAQNFKIYDGNITLTEVLQTNDGVPTGVIWEDNETTTIYANTHKGLTMIAQWRWRQAFIPQITDGDTYIDSASGGTINITNIDTGSEYYDSNHNGQGGKAYYATTNETITVTATANSGFTFEGWYDARGNLITTNPTYSYAETKESVNTYYARFSGSITQTYIRQIKNGDVYEITDNDNFGIIDRYTYVDAAGKPISATAIPTEEYKFDGWYDEDGNAVPDSMLINNGTTLSYITSENATYYARFSEKEIRPENRTVTAENYIGIYDGNKHGITVKNANLTGDVIYYSTDNRNWSTTKPTRKDVQDAETVFVKVENTTYKTVTTEAYIQITPRPVTLTVNDAEKYFGETDPDFTGSFTEGTLIDENDIGEITYHRIKSESGDEAVGNYPDVLTAEYTENTNYIVTVIPGDFTINIASIEGAMLQPAGGTKVYDGTPLFASAQVVGAEGYTIYFKTDNGDWTTEAPSVINVSEGEITVHTKAVKTGYEDLIGNDVTIQITPRPITITVNDAEKNFGDTDPVFTGAITNGSLVDNNDLGTITYYRTNNDEAVGNYPDVLTARYTANSNYDVTIVRGDFTIHTSSATGALLVPKGGIKVYDGTHLFASAQVTGAEGYTVYFKTNNSDWTTEAPSVTNVSEGEVTVHTKAVKTGYADLIGDDVTIQITPRPITITVNDAEKNFGETDPDFTGSITNGTLIDNNDIGEIVYYRTSNDETVGIYTDDLTARYTPNSNYNVTVIPGDFAIKANSVTGAVIIPAGGIKVYDGTPLFASAQVVGAEGYTVYFKTDNSDWTTEATSVTNVSEGEVTVHTKAVKTGYADLVGDDVTIQITPKPITITVNDAEKNFGETDPVFTGAITNGSLVDNNDLGEIVYYRTNNDETVGNYPDVLTARYTHNSNYDVTIVRGDFTIHTSSVTGAVVIPAGGVKVYDGTPLFASAQVIGAEGYTVYFKTDNSDWTTEAPSVTNVSEGEVTVYTKAVKTGYADLVGDDVTIQITPRPITITVNDAEKNFGETDPVFTGAITNGSLVDNNDLGEIVYYRTNNDETVGNYPDVLTARYTHNSNYDVTIVRGAFAINTSSVTGAVVIPAGGIKVYDGTPLFASAQVIGAEGYTVYFKTDNSDWTTEAPSVTNVSEGEVTVHTKAVKTGYADLVGDDVTIQITPRPITITVNDAEKNFGETDPVFTGSITNGSLVDNNDLGEIVYYRTNNDETVGNYPDVLTARYTHNSNYDVTIVRGDFTICTSSVAGAVVIPAGGTKVYDGTPLFASAQVVGAEGYTVYFKTDNSDWTTEAPSVTNVSEGEVTVHTKAVKTGYADLVGDDVTIQITPKPITITVNDAEKNFGETDPVFTGSITNGSLVDNNDLGEIIYYRTNNDETVGNYPDVLTTRYTQNSNYDVTIVRGDFAINTSSVTGAVVIPAGGIKVYDGTPLFASAQVIGAEGYTVYFKTDNSDWTTEAPSVTNVSEGEVTVHTKAVKTGYADLIGNDVTIRITPRNVTLTSASDSKVYDSTALTNHNVTISGDGFIETEGAEFTVTGSQTEIGSSSNKFTYTLNDNTDANNYNITVKEGTLTITPASSEPEEPEPPEEPETPVKPETPPTDDKPTKPEKPSDETDKPKPPTLRQDHVAYIIGYTDGLVHPENLITRAEVATIFFRLLSDESRSEFWSQTNPYSDVTQKNWYNNAVSTLTKAGIILGHPDGTFRPDDPITRAQFAAIAARFGDVIYDKECTFTDVPACHWAARYIALAEHLGWINGYKDNTFKPDRYITRAEAITLINRVLERDVETNNMLSNMKTWPDNAPGAWYYEAIQEATNSHDFIRTDKQAPGQDFNYEIWQKINPIPNWAGLEREWSTANSK